MSSDRLDQLLLALPDSDLPGELVQWLVRGIEAYHEGVDLGEALELDSDLRNRRDDLLRMCLELTPGESHIARCSYFFDVLDGQHPHENETAAKLIRKLQQLPVPVPRSAKQLGNIVRGDRAGSQGNYSDVCFPGWGYAEIG